MKRMIAEFEEQNFTQIIFPHAKSDWCEYLSEAQTTFTDIINAIIKYQKCLVICDDVEKVKTHFTQNKNLFFISYETNDTWARDCSVISLEENNEIKLLDFTFNGWGDKFESSKDNAMSSSIKKHYSKELKSIDFILEGGGVESNGAGVILTTSECLLNKNRNHTYNSIEITKKLNETLGSTKVLYLEHGYLEGDDTDSHIDTLARFVSEDTIVYVKCDDEEDEHYEELKLMQTQLQEIAKKHNFKLIALPFPHAIYYDDERLPATYANFLFVNGAVLVPTYCVEEDEEALKLFKKIFKDRDIVAVDCSTLVRQHGSLHCVTMNFAKGVDIIL